MSLQLHRPDGDGRPRAAPVGDRDWRAQLRSPRWGAGLRRGRLPDLKNPEMNPTSRFMSVLFWLGLAGLTFVVLVLGYGTGFWGSGLKVGVPADSPYTHASHALPFPFRRLERP